MINIGDILYNDYEIVEQIGEGGGGVVFKARHLRLNKWVVVKQIKEEVKGKLYSKQEADILKNLKHPNLPIVYNFLELESGIYTVIDYIEGESLEQIIAAKRPVTQEQIIKWGRQLADALAYLHSQTPPIIHSDIKPANIIIDSKGDATLIDFNVSVLFDDTAKFSVGISLGYAPPEQYRDIETYKKITHVTTIPGSDTEKVFSMITDIHNSENIEIDYEKTVYFMTKNSDDTVVFGDNDAVPVIRKTMCIDTRSDVYSLGAVLYHLATGNAPDVDFNNIKTLCSKELPLSEGLKIIIDKMMELAPPDRYQNGGEVFDAFQNIFKLDRRYVVLKRKERTLLLASIAFLLAGGALVGFGLKRIQIEENAYYENQILQADEYADNYDFIAASEIVTALEEKKPERLKAFEREVYYSYLAGNYEETQARINELFANQIVTENNYNTSDIIGNLYAIMGNCAYELEDYPNARGYIEQALEMVDDNPTYYRDYAVSLAKSGELEEAEAALQTAKSLGMDDASMNYVDAEIDSAKGNYKEALELLQPIIKDRANRDIFNRALLLAARNYIEIEDYENALLIYQEIYSSGVDTYQIGENISYLYSELGDLSESEKWLQDLAERFPNNYRVYKRLTILEVQKQDTKANTSRDYHKMKEYYDKAFELYEQSNAEDSEMDVLKTQMQNVIDGGWL